jgi:hypothetical protein
MLPLGRSGAAGRRLSAGTVMSAVAGEQMGSTVVRCTALNCVGRRSTASYRVRVFAGQGGDAGQTGCSVLVHTKVSASIDEQSKRMSLSSSGRMRCDLR